MAMTIDTTNYEWRARPRWATAHLVRTNTMANFNGVRVSMTLCGRHVNFDDTGEVDDGVKRCPRCTAKAPALPQHPDPETEES